MVVEKNVIVTINFAVPITYTQEKRIFGVATFADLLVASFKEDQRACSILWSIVFLAVFLPCI